MQPLHSSTTRLMADLYGLDASRNAEVKLSWYKLAIGAGEIHLHGLLTKRLNPELNDLTFLSLILNASRFSANPVADVKIRCR